MPFTLIECEELCKANRLAMTRFQLMEAYMVFGGIPFYLNMLNPRMSLEQNINQLCFEENGPLKHEFRCMLSSLFRNAEKHMAVIQMMSERKSGMTRKELSQNPAIGNGEGLTNTLSELEQ